MENALVEGASETAVVEDAAARFGVSVRQAWADLKAIRAGWEQAGPDAARKMHALTAMAKHGRAKTAGTEL